MSHKYVAIVEICHNDVTKETHTFEHNDIMKLINKISNLHKTFKIPAGMGISIKAKYYLGM